MTGDDWRSMSPEVDVDQQHLATPQNEHEKRKYHDQREFKAQESQESRVFNWHMYSDIVDDAGFGSD